MERTFYGLSTKNSSYSEIKALWIKVNDILERNELENKDNWIRIGVTENDRYFLGIPVNHPEFKEEITIDCDEFEMINFKGSESDLFSFVKSQKNKMIVEIHTQLTKTNGVDLLLK